jgi:hypothetical protein
MKLTSEQTRRMKDFIRRKWLQKSPEEREYITSKLKQKESKNEV